MHQDLQHGMSQPNSQFSSFVQNSSLQKLDPQVLGNNSLDNLNATMASCIEKEQTFVLNDLDQCDICKIPYKSKGSLKTHLISKHGVPESSVFFSEKRHGLEMGMVG